MVEPFTDLRSLRRSHHPTATQRWFSLRKSKANCQFRQKISRSSRMPCILLLKTIVALLTEHLWGWIFRSMRKPVPPRVIRVNKPHAWFAGYTDARNPGQTGYCNSGYSRKTGRRVRVGCANFQTHRGTVLHGSDQPTLSVGINILHYGNSYPCR